MLDCAVIPPLSVGAITITESSTTNEFIFNFLKWGGEDMDLTKYSYSAIISIGTVQIDLCAREFTLSPEGGLICNTGNRL